MMTLMGKTMVAFASAGAVLAALDVDGWLMSDTFLGALASLISGLLLALFGGLLGVGTTTG